MDSAKQATPGALGIQKNGKLTLVTSSHVIVCKVLNVRVRECKCTCEAHGTTVALEPPALEMVRKERT